ncbi:carcinoembryonic antigen-related cell adhesion molecule 6-like [Amblyraja radiata]|uniref:carcinoembryonic antigen-related cell adhesion molecule 6-like n=1 Tax=Amblyraja radiata TaxID=386614 RepID=UPI001403F8A7|nr:carcinoembryonic antigen-related cell adhesion molecule 6-like [Amblyraja radiata]
MQTCRPSACESSRTQLICKPSPPLVLLSKDRMYRAVQLVIVLFVPTKITRGVDTEIASADGGSVMFPGVGADRRSGVAVFQWKKAGGTAGKGSAMKPVLQFHSGSREPAVIRSYAGRLTFFPHNGSMAFHNLTQQDAGLYQLYINLQKDAIQSVRLTVMDRLSEVSVWSNSSSLGSVVQLSCAVVGNPHEYQWRKDGGDISRHHQLMNGNMNLIIPRASSIDCGTYTCIASNPVSSAQKNLTLTIYGVPAEQIVVMMVWGSGLLYSGLSLIGSTFLCAYKCAPITGRC